MWRRPWNLKEVVQNHREVWPVNYDLADATVLRELTRNFGSQGQRRDEREDRPRGRSFLIGTKGYLSQASIERAPI